MPIRRAFTLTEMLIVISIIAILIGLLIPAISLVRNSMTRTKVTSLLNNLDAALVAYRANYGVFPEAPNSEQGRPDPVVQDLSNALGGSWPSWVQNGRYRSDRLLGYDASSSKPEDAAKAGLALGVSVLATAIRISNEDLWNRHASKTNDQGTGKPFLIDAYGNAIRYLPAKCYPIPPAQATQPPVWPDAVPNADGYLLWSPGADHLDTQTTAGPFIGMPMGGGDDLGNWKS